MFGAVAGNRLGAVRDAKNKSVAAVFSELGGQQKAEVLFLLQYIPTFLTSDDSLDPTCFGTQSSWISFIVELSVIWILVATLYFSN